MNNKSGFFTLSLSKGKVKKGNKEEKSEQKRVLHECVQVIDLKIEKINFTFG